MNQTASEFVAAYRICAIRMPTEDTALYDMRNTGVDYQLTQHNCAPSCCSQFLSGFQEGALNSDYFLENVTSMIGTYSHSAFGSSIFSITLSDPIF